MTKLTVIEKKYRTTPSIHSKVIKTVPKKYSLLWKFAKYYHIVNGQKHNNL